MKKNSLSKDTIGGNLPATSPVTRAMVHERTRGLALIAGRGPQLVTQADYEQAKRELTGESDMDRQDAILDSLPEENRWSAGPRSAGHQRPESFSEEENAERRSETDQLVGAGAKGSRA